VTQSLYFSIRSPLARGGLVRGRRSDVSVDARDRGGGVGTAEDAWNRGGGGGGSEDAWDRGGGIDGTVEGQSLGRRDADTARQGE
jgi:hypothetical protein